MNYRYLRAASVTRVFMLILIACIVAFGSSPENDKVKEAIEKTQTMTNIISRCVGADDKHCGEGLALAKLAKQSTEAAYDVKELSDGAKTHIRNAMLHLTAVIQFMEQGRLSEALPVGNNALSALHEANKSS